LPENVGYIEWNVGDIEILAPLLVDCDEVIDLAYASVPKTSFDDPTNDVLENLPPGVTLLRQCVKHGVKRVLLVSSGGTVYGNPLYLPIDEGHPTDPISPYGITKLALEKYAQFFNRIEGLPVVIVRPGNPYGPNQLGMLQQGFIGASLDAVLNKKTINVFGQRGTVRDYIFIDDLSRGLVAALMSGEAGKTYNIGTGIGHDNYAVLHMLEEIASNDGFEVKWRNEPQRAYDVTENVLSAARLTYVSGWRPEVDLRRGLQLSWEWARRLKKL
jgi:UDP-glucose 4-epimerase